MKPKATKTLKRPSAAAINQARDRTVADGQAIVTAMQATATSAAATRYDPFAAPQTS